MQLSSHHHVAPPGMQELEECMMQLESSKSAHGASQKEASEMEAALRQKIAALEDEGSALACSVILRLALRSATEDPHITPYADLYRVALVTRALSLGKDGAASAAAAARDEMQRKMLAAEEEQRRQLEAASMNAKQQLEAALADAAAQKAEASAQHQHALDELHA
eukprot:scaffold18282_cov19-Tisochrysis_lutea.AAC.2